MKVKYKLCVIIWLTELIAIFILEKANFQLESILVNAIGVFAFLLPLVVLFILMSKDEAFATKKRMIFRFVYIWLIFCYLAGLLAKLGGQGDGSAVRFVLDTLPLFG